ncbi:MAG: dihydrolipoamide acetyltransferase family protein [Flavobacteriales bacterium AspAUS03]
MAEVIAMPRLSDTMEEGTVVKWNKKVGDQISEGDILAEIETDKAIQEFEIDISGRLLYIGVGEKQAVKVDEILAIIGQDGEDISALIHKGSQVKIPPRAPHSTVVSLAIPQQDRPDNPQNQSPKVIPQKNNNQRIFASPLAKRMAAERNISLSEINGSGEHGRIVKRNVEQYQSIAAQHKTEGQEIIPSIIPSLTPSLVKREVPHSSMRKIIAKRLTESKFAAPHYYLMMEIDMEQAIQSRQTINEKFSSAKVSFNDLVVKAIALALRKHPTVNASWTEGKIIYHSDINIGVAVAVEDGLLVPVIQQTDQKSLSQISTEIKDKADRARVRKIEPQEMEGSTFTISNLGMFGIESFTSIINQPNSCILSVGAIVEKPVVKDGQIVIGHTMKVTLACDHRTVDGAKGSAFLQIFKQILENPVLMLA